MDGSTSSSNDEPPMHADVYMEQGHKHTDKHKRKVAARKW